MSAVTICLLIASRVIVVGFWEGQLSNRSSAYGLQVEKALSMGPMKDSRSARGR
jgi:hypothetical protein